MVSKGGSLQSGDLARQVGLGEKNFIALSYVGGGGAPLGENRASPAAGRGQSCGRDAAAGLPVAYLKEKLVAKRGERDLRDGINEPRENL